MSEETSRETEQDTRDGGAPVEELKRPPRPGGKLKPERVQLMLETMPGWRLSPAGNSLLRTQKFAQPGEAASFASTIAALSMGATFVLTLGVSAHRVTLRLQRPNRNGIDMPLLDFARQIV
jgi:pterin-4a-carbinolamine dehydratase